MAVGQKFGRNEKKCARYRAEYRYEKNRDRRAKARAVRLKKRAAETREKRETARRAAHHRRHLLKHGLPATQECAHCNSNRTEVQ